MRVLKRHPAEILPFEETETYLQEQWEFDKRREIQQKKIARLRKQYRVVLPDAFGE